MQANALRQGTCTFIHSGSVLWSICLYDLYWAGRPYGNELRWTETKIPTAMGTLFKLLGTNPKQGYANQTSAQGTQHM